MQTRKFISIICLFNPINPMLFMSSIIENRIQINAFHEFLDNHPELWNENSRVQRCIALKNNVVSLQWAKENWKGTISMMERMDANKRK